LAEGRCRKLLAALFLAVEKTGEWQRMTAAGFPLDADGTWIGPADVAAMPGPAVFLDRDGVLVEDVPYLHRPAEVRLAAGAAELLVAAARAGWRRVLVTNQSGIGRGLYGWAEFAATQAEIDCRLALAGAGLDLVVVCPFHAAAQAAFRVADHPDRKPNPGMLLKAARRLGLDLAASVIVGDPASDLEAGRRAGLGRGFLLCADEAEVAAAEAMAGSGFRVARIGQLHAVAGLLGLNH